MVLISITVTHRTNNGALLGGLSRGGPAPNLSSASFLRPYKKNYDPRRLLYAIVAPFIRIPKESKAVPGNGREFLPSGS